MAEPMSAETSPQSEPLKQKKEEIVEQLKKQNEGLGGNVLKFIQRTDGSELMVFTRPTSIRDDLGRYGGYCDGAVIIEGETGNKLMSERAPVVEEITRILTAGGGLLRTVNSDRDFETWKDSLKQSEESAANLIKQERADAHYTPKLLAAIGEMPNVLAAGGFDLYAEMRKMPVKTNEIPDVASSAMVPESQFGVAHADPGDVARMDAESRNQAAMDAKQTLGHTSE